MGCIVPRSERSQAGTDSRLEHCRIQSRHGLACRGFLLQKPYITSQHVFFLRRAASTHPETKRPTAAIPQSMIMNKAALFWVKVEATNLLPKPFWPWRGSYLCRLQLPGSRRSREKSTISSPRLLKLQRGSRSRALAASTSLPAQVPSARFETMLQAKLMMARDVEVVCSEEAGYVVGNSQSARGCDHVLGADVAQI